MARRRWIIEWLVVLIVAVTAAVGARVFLVQTFFIPSGSMMPTLDVGDHIVVDKLSYHLHGVGRGDIVVFSRPPGLTGDPGVTDLVKRVIGLPGDTISAVGGNVYINGRPLSEPWLPKGVRTYPGPPGTRFSLAKPFKVPAGEYFVMGDNRGDSEDSRYFGPISGKLIIGHALARIWPLSRLDFLF